MQFIIFQFLKVPNFLKTNHNFQPFNAIANCLPAKKLHQNLHRIQGYPQLSAGRWQSPSTQLLLSSSKFQDISPQSYEETGMPTLSQLNENYNQMSTVRRVIHNTGGDNIFHVSLSNFLKEFNLFSTFFSAENQKQLRTPTHIMYI